MKIVRIIARLNVGGPARHVTWLTAALQDASCRSVLIAGTVPEGEQDMGYFAADHGVEPIFIPEMSRELSALDSISFIKIARCLFREKPDIVHTHTAKAGTLGRMAALFYRIVSRKEVRVVHTYHGHVFHSYYGRLLTNLFLVIERFLARFATDRIVTISPQQRFDICETFRVGKPEQYEVIELGIDFTPFENSPADRDSFRTEIGLETGEFAVGFVGRITGIKNLPMLIEAARQLQESGRSAGLRFVVIGDGNLRDDIVAEAEARGLGSLFVFAGNRTDTGRFYAGLDAVALTSLNEGTPLSLIEAMASGKPVIGTSVGGVADLVGEVMDKSGGLTIHERGLTVASGDALSLADGILRLKADEDLRARLASAGSSFVRSRYGMDRLVRDVRRLYEELTAGNP